MKIIASTWNARRVLWVQLDGEFIENVTAADDVNGYVDVIRVNDGHIVQIPDVGPVIDRLYGRVAIVQPRLSRRVENRSSWSRRKRRRVVRSSSQRSTRA